MEEKETAKKWGMEREFAPVEIIKKSAPMIHRC